MEKPRHFTTIMIIFCLFSSCGGQQQLGLQIDNQINRGTNYTDPQGRDYSLRYIPVTLTNDRSVPIRMEVVFKEKYSHPDSESNETFRLIPLPEKWALDGVGISDTMIESLSAYVEDPVFTKTIAPGEKIRMAIGALYARPTRTSGVLPRTLFVQGDAKAIPDCEWILENEENSGAGIFLGLKLVFGDRCRNIPCGRIWYTEE